ncbi:hypothetical protein G3A43_06485 [Paraburkholderia aspalathi]|nr:hypothetical protein [Paraburkholderia aspalathi]MBK3779896.1 hypothetical protein [Paraburkholderia aspalathi]
MFKKTLVAAIAAIGSLAALSASAAESLTCSPPVINAPSATSEAAQYAIHCSGMAHRSIQPDVTFQGEVLANGTPPYRATPSYVIDIRSDSSRELSSTPREDQLATGVLETSTLSVAALPAQLAGSTVWDADSGTLSIEDKPGRWHIYTLRVFDEGDMSEQTLTDAGYASQPITGGQATVAVEFDKKFSRFAGRIDTLPVVNAQLGLRDGKLEMRVGDTRVAAEPSIQGAMMQLDRKPKDITRAWALASRAQFLGLDDEVRYAEEKVAAHNPQLLEEFQADVERIQPYVLPAH